MGMRTVLSNAAGSRRRATAIAAVAAAVVVVGGVAAAVIFQGKDPSHATASLSGTRFPATPSSATPSFSAVADVTPPVAASACSTPTTFTYSGTLSASAPGTVTYRWVYSAGSPGPEQTVSFAAAGDRQVTGQTVRTKTFGGGWGKLEVISPVARTSNEAAYKLLCGSGTGGVGGITATAAATPASRTVSCVTAAPAFTVTGLITTAKAETVTYYWARSDGADSVPATLTFTTPGAKAVQALTFTPPRASGSGQAVLVVTSPVTTASTPAAYTLTCKAPTAPTTSGAPTAPTTPTATTNPTAPPTSVRTAPPTSPQTVPATTPTSPKSSSSNSAPPDMTLTVNLPTTATVGQPYSGTATATGGDGTYNWSVTGLPPGLIYTANGGTLTVSGTPTLHEAFDVVDIHVSDGESPPGMLVRELNIPVNWQPITFTSNMPLTATVGQPYLGTVTVSGGTGSTYGWTFALLPGLTATVNGATATISGTPTKVNPDSNGNLSNISVLIAEGTLNAGQSYPVVVSAS